MAGLRKSSIDFLKNIKSYNKMVHSKVRESSFELVRLIAQMMIVIYHIYLVAIEPVYNVPFNKAIWLPLHIGVPLFVLISGYWGIHISGKGLARLLGQMLIYTAIFTIAYDYLTNGGGYRPIINNLMLVSRSPMWFMRTYICLYLFSPVINKYLYNITTKQRVYLLLSLLFISVYIGTFGNDPSLSDGKNLANFLTLYVIGNTLHVYEKVWRSWSTKWLLMVYIALNICLVIGYCLGYDTFISKGIYRLSFPYMSPVLLINSVLFLIIVVKRPFYSSKVNYLAASSLAIYLLHSTFLISRCVWKPFCLWIRGYVTNDYLFFFVAVLIALFIVFICIIIDKLLSPLWRWFMSKGEQCEEVIIKLTERFVNGYNRDE